jgi:citronellol/citronellal dehydrogenase
MNLAGKNVFITGGSRGIGRAIALRLAEEGANVAIAAKTAEAHPKLEGTIYSTAAEVESLQKGRALPLKLDIRDEQAIAAAVEAAAAAFGGIDILINNASAINLSAAESLEVKRFDLMNDINVRGTFLMSQACIPWLKKSKHAHIINLSPPLNMHPAWFARHLPYTMSKYGMSMIVLGLSAELKKYRIGVNALWPKTTIATAAISILPGGDDIMRRSRKPEIVADAAFEILTRDPDACTGNFFTDEEVLRSVGITDFERYAVTPGEKLMPDLFV